MNLNYKIIGDRELVMYLEKLNKGMKPQIISGLKKIATHLNKSVKSKFGQYQSGWPKLKRASVIAKYAGRSLKGIKTKGVKAFSIGPDQPLILFGNLRDSIEKEVHTGSLEAEIYTDNIYAAVHEYGYKNVPARSYMRLTLDEEQEEVVDIMGRQIGKLI